VAPLPVSSFFNGPQTQVVVNFDSPLAFSGSTPGHWFVRLNNLVRGFSGPVVALGFTITLELAGGGPNVGEDVVTYDGLDPSMRGVNDVRIEAFEIKPELQPVTLLSAEYSVGGGFIDITFSEPVTIVDAVKQDFEAVVEPNALNVQSLVMTSPLVLRLVITIDGPGSGPNFVSYAGHVNGLEVAGGDDIVAFVMELTSIP